MSDKVEGEGGRAASAHVNRAGQEKQGGTHTRKLTRHGHRLSAHTLAAESRVAMDLQAHGGAEAATALVLSAISAGRQSSKTKVSEDDIVSLGALVRVKHEAGGRALKARRGEAMQPKLNHVSHLSPTASPASPKSCAKLTGMQINCLTLTSPNPLASPTPTNLLGARLAHGHGVDGLQVAGVVQQLQAKLARVVGTLRDGRNVGSHIVRAPLRRRTGRAGREGWGGMGVPG